MLACSSEKMVSVPLMVKLNKISSYLSSFQAENLPFRRNVPHLGNDEQPDGNRCNEESGRILSEQQSARVTTCPSPTSDKVKVYYSTDVKVSSKQPMNNIVCRLKTYVDLSWLLPINILSVYECVRRGWYLLQLDMLCCCCCNQMVCLQLPPSHSPSYGHAVSILRDRVLSKHKGNCRYRSCPDPVATTRPPSLLTTPHLYSLAAAAHQLAGLASSSTGGGTRLPYLDNGGKDVMDRLGVSSSLLQEVWGSEFDDEWQQIAVLLVLCGWKATTATDTIRCELCQRSIGFWHFLSYTEYHEREASLSVTPALQTYQAATDTTVVTEEYSATTAENTGDLTQKPGDGISVGKPEDQLVVAERREDGIESELNKTADRQDPADSMRVAGVASVSEAVVEVGASGDHSHGAETDRNCDSIQKSISSKGGTNNTPGAEPKSDSGTKRKRAECEDETNKKDQLRLVPEARDEGGDDLPSKRSKPSGDQQSPDATEPLPAGPGVSEEDCSTSDAPQVLSKPLFCPYSQHRYWCGWTTSEGEHLKIASECVASGPSRGAQSSHRREGVGNGDPTTGAGDNSLPGYVVFAQQLKSVVLLAQGKQWTTSDKYAKTVDGLRSVRAHLSSWAK